MRTRGSIAFAPITYFNSISLVTSGQKALSGTISGMEANHNSLFTIEKWAVRVSTARAGSQHTCCIAGGNVARLALRRHRGFDEAFFRTRPRGAGIREPSDPFAERKQTPDREPSLLSTPISACLNSAWALRSRSRHAVHLCFKHSGVLSFY